MNDKIQNQNCQNTIDHSGLLFSFVQVILSSHSELRCPECRVLVDIKIDNLPPNVLLMRILEGMKNAISPPNVHTNNITGTEAISLPNLKQSQPFANQTALKANGPNNDLGMGINHIKRTVPLNPEPVHRVEHRALIKSNEESMNSIRSNQPARQPLQNVPTSALNSNSLQTLGTSPSIPHAKALYDFESKESG